MLSNVPGGVTNRIQVLGPRFYRGTAVIHCLSFLRPLFSAVTGIMRISHGN